MAFDSIALSTGELKYVLIYNIHLQGMYFEFHFLKGA